MNVKEFFQKRVFGIPVLYLVGVVVAVFGVIAWRMKGAPSGDASGDAGTDGAPGSGDAGAAVNGDLAGSVYDQLKTSGTVVVAPVPPDSTVDQAVETNSTWLSKGIQWLVAQDKATGTVAEAALSKYLEGQDYSYDEQALVDAWYKQGGPPPDGVSAPGKAGTKPAQKQGNPPLVHEVKGTNDDTYGKVATLYYGHNEQQTYDIVQAANVDKLGMSNGPFVVGTKIVVPVYHVPKYYKLPYDMDAKTLAGKNGITVAQLEALNNVNRTQWKKGTTARVA